MMQSADPQSSVPLTSGNPQKQMSGGVRNNNRSHYLLVILGLSASIALVWFLAIGIQKSGTPIPSTLIGTPAREFRIKVIQDQAGLARTSQYYLRLHDLKGKNVVLNFWASWCQSCRSEAHDLEKLWRTLPQEETVVVGVAIQDSLDAAKAFAEQYGKTYSLGLDESGSVSIDYGITGVPESFFIDKNGIIKHKEAAPLDFATLQRLVNTHF